jgi:hypothetical protein
MMHTSSSCSIIPYFLTYDIPSAFTADIPWPWFESTEMERKAYQNIVDNHPHILKNDTDRHWIQWQNYGAVAMREETFQSRILWRDDISATDSIRPSSASSRVDRCEMEMWLLCVDFMEPIVWQIRQPLPVS